MIYFLYGPPGSGKTTLGRSLAAMLEIPFLDLDDETRRVTGKSIPNIFQDEGESGFRAVESHSLQKSITAAKSRDEDSIIALGGGALLAEENRRLVESSGQVIFLQVPQEVLLSRVQRSMEKRPLLDEDSESRLPQLLLDRADHYASFNNRVDSSLPVADAVWQIQVLVGAFRVSGMGRPYDIRVEAGGLTTIGEKLSKLGSQGRVALVSDDTVADLYATTVGQAVEASGYACQTIRIRPGEFYKNLDTLEYLWNRFLQAGLDRHSTVVALGGGVVGDLAGFAAATYLRGIRWVNIPTTLLAMVDASLGGKTGIDLPQGKNLVGAFHSPSYVLADPEVLGTLPEDQFRNGLAEVVKHGIIADPILFDLCAAGFYTVQGDLEHIVRRAMAVKVRIIQEDPYEKERRAALNLGHTLGHAIEKVSGFRLKHGEAVAIGTVHAARLASRMGITVDPGLSQAIERTLGGLGLPVTIPEGLDRNSILQAMSFDKKKAGGMIRWVLPVRIGEVQIGVPVADPWLTEDSN